MRLIIILPLIFHLSTVELKAGGIDTISMELLSFERQYFLATNAEERTSISFQKLQTYLKFQLSLDKECLHEANRIKPEWLTPTQQQHFYWNAALLYLLNNNYSTCADMLANYQALVHDTSMSAQLVQMIAQYHSPYDSLETRVISVDLQPLYTCLMEETQMAARQHSRYVWCSYVVPGSGMVFKGYVMKGVTAFSLNALSGVFVYSLLRHSLYLNAGAYFLLTLTKFYQGNVVLTKKLVSKRENKTDKKVMQSCHRQLEQLLNDHPLQFKY